MGSKWRKVKLALGMNTCVFVPRALDDSSSSLNSAARLSLAHSRSSVSPPDHISGYLPMTPTPSSSGLRLPGNGTKSPKGICAICLTAMKPGLGHAIFTAECSHSFHFHCITSNVKHGNRICPVCKEKWKEVPFQGPASNASQGMSRITQPGGGEWTTVFGRLPSPQAGAGRQSSSPCQVPEPAIFNDDDAFDQQTSSTPYKDRDDSLDAMEIRTYPEISAVPKSISRDNFAVLIHLKAPRPGRRQNIGENNAKTSPFDHNPRAPIDLVTVLDVSGSMAGTKLALLKRAMGFVIQHLGPADRLSVVAFSSTARRIFPLRRMSDTGRQEALQAVNSLVSNGGTNIAGALRKGLKVFVDRQWKNPVGSIILLSDGQDTYTVTSSRPHVGRDYRSLVPNSINRNNGVALQIPVHAFGFGADHDATLMHSISDVSGGTYSFIEAEDVIQDAFAQCIGGLLSVVVQELQVEIVCVYPRLQLTSVKAGSYRTSMMANSRKASIQVGDLYADEERDFLVTVNVPVDGSSDEMSLVIVRSLYRDPITKEMVALKDDSEVKIQRPETASEATVSIDVDRQRNRLLAAEAMADARVAAERGDLAAAVSILDSRHKALSETVSAQAGDRLCAALSAELKEMQERMANHRVYEQSGRAYVLSGLSSHSWQRATTRGDSTDSSSLVQAYQTPSMVDMVSRSQTMLLGSPQARRSLRPAKSFPERHRL